MSFSRAVLTAACLLPAVVVSLASPDAEACSFETGFQGAFPPSGSTLAANDSIILALLWTHVSELGLSVQVDGEDVPFETSTRFPEKLVFLSNDFIEIAFPGGTPPVGSTITVRGESGTEFGNPLELTYVVGPADDTPLIDAGGEPEMSLSLISPEEGDTCGIPERYSASATIPQELNDADGERTRFLQMTFYRAEGGPTSVVGRGVAGPGDRGSRISANFPGGEDPSTLCAQVSVDDAFGNSEILLEDCDLCGSFPEVCEQDEDQSCSVGGRGSFPWTLALLAFAGVVRRRRNVDATRTDEDE